MIPCAPPRYASLSELSPPKQNKNAETRPDMASILQKEIRMPRPVGRTPKLTPEVQAKIVQALRLGATWTIACQAAGISLSSARAWKALGRANRKPYVEFLLAASKAEAEGALIALGIVGKAARGGDRRAAQYLLDRRHRYGARTADDLPDEAPGLEGMLAAARRMRRAAEAEASYVAAASLLASERELLAELSEQNKGREAEALSLVPVADLVAAIAEAIDGLSAAEKAALLVRLQ